MANVSGKKVLLATSLALSISLDARPRKQELSTPQPKTTAPESKTPEVQKTTNITVKNVITPEMTAYQYCGSHVPELFSLELNGQKIEPGEEKKIDVSGNELQTTYHYSFAHGLYKGTNTCTIAVPEGYTQGAVHFSWHKEPRVWLEKVS